MDNRAEGITVRHELDRSVLCNSKGGNMRFTNDLVAIRLLSLGPQTAILVLTPPFLISACGSGLTANSTAKIGR
jgi:hypothetical protein